MFMTFRNANRSGGGAEPNIEQRAQALIEENGPGGAARYVDRRIDKLLLQGDRDDLL